MDQPSTVTISGSHNQGSQVGINSGTVNNYFNSQPQSTKLKPSSNVPFSKDLDFVDRGDILTWLDEICSRPAGRAALVGFGGFGKSQLAIEYAHRLRERSPDSWIFWVHASNSARVEEGLINVAERVGLLSKPSNAAAVVPLVKKWLSDEANGRWLIIVDNADDEITIEGQKQAPGMSLTSMLPQTHHGAILVTSRNDDVALSLVGRQQDIIRVDKMSENEAVQLLQKKMGDQVSDGASLLVQTLDCIPLAIVQAAAYLNRLGPRMPLVKYLDELKRTERQNQLLQRATSDIRRDGEAMKSVLATWQISFEYIRERRLSAAHLLSLMSFFNQQGIPEFMIRYHTCVNGEKHNQLTTDDSEFEEDIALLRSFSLVGITKKSDEFEMHKLVQLATRIWLSSSNLYERWQQTFIHAMAMEFPRGDFENWSKCKILFPHVSHLLEQVEQVSQDYSKSEDYALLMNNVGWYLRQQRQSTTAKSLLTKAVRIRKEILGAEHSSTNVSLSLLSSALKDLGQYAESEIIDRQLLVTNERLFGKGDSNTLAIMNNIAFVLDCQGKYEEAESIYRTIIAIREEKFGKDHPRTLESGNNLAFLLESIGKYDEATTMYKQVLAARERVLGKENPNTLISMNNYALMLCQQNKFEEAETMLREVLVLREKILGKEHPDTWRSINNIGFVLNAQERYEEAEPMYRKTLEKMERVLGLEHPDTLTIMNNVADTMTTQGKLEEAISRHRKILLTREKLFGKKHPDTLRTVHILAYNLDKRKEFSESSVLYERALDRFSSVLGKDHPLTQACQGNYLRMQSSQKEGQSDVA